MKVDNESAARALGLIEEGEAFRRLSGASRRKRFDVIVIGGGQAGLSVGYHLKKLGLDFVILTGMRGPARRGESGGTRCASSRPIATTASTACPFPHRPTRFRRRTRWPTISRDTPSTSRYR